MPLARSHPSPSASQPSIVPLGDLSSTLFYFRPVGSVRDDHGPDRLVDARTSSCVHRASSYLIFPNPLDTLTDPNSDLSQA